MVCLLFCTSCSFYICLIWKYGFNCFVISNFFDFFLSVLLSIFLSTLKAVNIKVVGGEGGGGLPPEATAVLNLDIYTTKQALN